MGIKSGSIYFRKDVHWLLEYKDELVAFDKGTHDYQVDVTSYAARCLVEMFADNESEPFIIGIKINDTMCTPTVLLKSVAP